MADPRFRQTQSHSRWLTAALVLILGVLLVVPFLIVAPGTEFGGADAAAVEELEARGVHAWFEPLFSPGSAEVESGLFALQAGIGGAVLGYVVGRLQGPTRRGRDS